VGKQNVGGPTGSYMLTRIRYDHIRLEWRAQGSPGIIDCSPTIQENQWLFGGGLYKGSDYFNAFDAEGPATQSSISNDMVDGTHTDFGLGGYATSNFMTGYMDEARVSDIIRSEAWLNATKHTMNQTTGFLTFGPQIDYNEWDANNWDYSRVITIDNDNIETTLTNFPFLFHETYTDWIAQAQSDGDDFVFSSADNLIQYNHEIESYNSTSGELIAWVNVTSISDSTDTTLYIHWGNSNCDSMQSETDTWDSNYLFVSHMDDKTSSTIDDSTINSNDGTETNTPVEIDGKIGKAQDFESTDDDYFTLSDDISN
jgi:hypothetical protein